MQMAEFQARTDLEPGDLVKLKHSSDILEVNEIRCDHYLVARTVEFKFQLKNHAGLFTDWLNREDIEVIQHNDGTLPKLKCKACYGDRFTPLNPDETRCDTCGKIITSLSGYTK